METQNEEITNCEHNLKIHYDMKKAASETMLRSIIPAQHSDIKTVLWMNFIIIGIVTKLNTINWLSIDTGILVLSGYAISVCLYALIFLREKYLGSVPGTTKLYDLEENEWKKSYGLLYALECIEEALKKNTKYQNKRSDLTAIATGITLIAMILMIIKFSNQM